MGYLNLKKIQFNLADSTKLLKWWLSNEKVNLTYVHTFKLSLKLSQSFVELNVNDKHVTRFELVDDQHFKEQLNANAPTTTNTSVAEPPFQIEQIKFSNNFILSNSVSFIVGELSVNDLRYEVTATNGSADKLTLNTLEENSSSSDFKSKLIITESLNINFFNSSEFNLDAIVTRLNDNEQYCPLKKYVYIFVLFYFYNS